MHGDDAYTYPSYLKKQRKQTFYTISGHINIMGEGSHIVSAQYSTLTLVQLHPILELKKVTL